MRRDRAGRGLPACLLLLASASCRESRNEPVTLAPAATQPASRAAERRGSMESPPRWWDVRHMDLTLVLSEDDIRNRRMRGVVEYTVAPRHEGRSLASDRRSLALEAVRLDVARVEAAFDSPAAAQRRPEWRPARFEARDERLFIELARAPHSEFRLRIEYSVERPRLGLHFVPADESRPERAAMVYSMSEPLQARCWLPSCDWPDARWTSDIRIRVAPPMSAVSIGVPVGEPARESDKPSPLVTHHWRQATPVDPHMLGFAVGEFTTLRDEWRGRPVLVYSHPRYAEAARYTFRRVPEMLEFYSRFTGVEYPWPQFSHVVVQDHFHGGMEHIGFDMLAPSLLTESDDGDLAAEDSEFNYVAHMLGHQWFGGLVNYARLPEAWVNEGFATYLHQLWHTQAASYDGDTGGGMHGEDWLAHDLARSAELVARFDVAGTSGPLVNESLSDPDQVYSFDAGKVYWKGAWVLHMLRRQVGDEAFRAALRLYLLRHSDPRRADAGLGDTARFQKAAEDASGRDLSLFFDQWVRRGGTPRLTVAYAWDAERGVARVTARQTQRIDAANPPFALPIELYFADAESSRTAAAVLTEAEQSWEFDLAAAPTVFCVDPHGVLLKSLTEKKPDPMWIEQLARGPTALARSQAIDRLRGVKSPEATAALRNALADESLFWGTRRRAAASLGAMRTEESLATLLAVERLGVAHPRVLEAVLDALGGYEDSPAVQAVLLRHAGAQARTRVRTAALRKLARCRADPALRSAALAALAEAARPACNRRVRDAALDALESMNDADALPALLGALDPRAADRDASGALTARTISLLVKLAADRGEQRSALLEFLSRFPDEAHRRVRDAVRRAKDQLRDAASQPARAAA